MSSHSSNQLPITRFIELAGGIAHAATREASARAYAEAAGATYAIVFIRDPDIGELLPAPGFPRTLPGHTAWRAFLSDCARDGQGTAELSYPAEDQPLPTTGVAFQDQAVLVLLGGSPSPAAVAASRLTLPLLAAGLQGERAIQLAEAQAALARRNAQESRTLAAVLDGARGELQEALATAEERQAVIKRQAAELEAILEAIPDAVSVSDMAGNLVLVNAKAVRLFGLPSARSPVALRDAYSTAWLCTPDGTPLPPEETPLSRALAGTASDNRHLVLRQPDAHGREDVQMLISAAPLLDESGHQTGAVAVGTDVTALYRLQEQKDEFLSIASHELRTPLTTLKALVQLAARALKSGRPLDQLMLARMEPAIGRMERLIADLLDTSRIQEGKLQFRFEPANLPELCRRVVEELAATTNRAIHAELPDEQITLLVDADRIMQVLVNLLTNALKYSAVDAPVVLTLERREGHVVTSVRDHGQGIPADALPHVFDRFYRVADMPVQNGSQVGLGLGLYIARTIVERHGGEMGVQSEPGAGSTFWFTLPLPSRVNDAEGAEPVSSLCGGPATC